MTDDVIWACARRVEFLLFSQASEKRESVITRMLDFMTALWLLHAHNGDVIINTFNRQSFNHIHKIKKKGKCCSE